MVALVPPLALFLLIIVAYLWDGPNVVVFGHLTLASADGSVTAVPEAGGDSARQACLLFLFGAVVAIGFRTRGARFLFAIPMTFVPLLGWCWLSLAWAIDPEAALRRVVFTTLVILSIVYALHSMSYRQVINVLMAAFASILLIDYLAVAVFPLAIHQAIEAETLLAGAWRGMHNHKNEAGALSAMALMLVLHETVRLRSVLTGPLLVAAAAGFLFKSEAKTSEGCVLVAMVIGLTARFAFQRPRVRMTLLVAAVLAVAAVLPFADDLLVQLAATLDDPAALTGRVQIWPVLLQYASDHPLLGAGYGSFWSIGEASPIFRYGSGWVASIDHSHNGYLEILIQTGAIGLALSIGCLVIQPFWALFTQPLDPEMSRSLIASILAFGCLHDLLETSLLYRANSTWVMMVIMYCLLSKARLPRCSSSTRELK